MTAFTVLVVPDGRTLLTTTERLTDQMMTVLREAIALWDAEHLLVLGDCEVVQVAAIDIDLDVAVPA